MKILMISPEVAPYSKTGGLGDMVGALTKEIAALGHEVRVVSPLYGSIRPGEDWQAFPGVVSVHLGGGREDFCRLWQAPIKGSTAHANFIEFERYFGRAGIYGEKGGGYLDNMERFVFLCRAVLDGCIAAQWIPDVIHCHDWTTALVPVYLNTRDRAGPLGHIATVFTIHNLQHQGYFARDILDFAGLPQWLYTPDNLESCGSVNLMKGGLYHATKLTTVSRTYAREIQTGDGGCGLDPVLRFRAGDLIGVTNGIDITEWNPATDPRIPAKFSAADLSGKAACKAELQKRFGLEVNPGTALFTAVARLVDQKGLDLLASIVPGLMEQMYLQIAIIGTGDPAIENAFRQLAAFYPGRVGTFIGFDENLAHLAEAGADFFMMPSRFEPCGLNQMYSQAYGTPPIVRDTGGLVDTVDAYEHGQTVGTGFYFHEPTTGALFHAIGRACGVYYDRPAEMLAMRLNGMRKDFSWARSARQYAAIYGWAVKARNG